MRNRLIVAAIGLAAIVAAGLSALDVTARYAADDEARAAAGAWLALIDAGEYEASWAEAATTFQQSVTAGAWAAQAAAARRQIGDVRARSFVAVEVMRDPPGAPPGEYVRVRFDTDLTVAGTLAEMVVLVRDGDRGLRVAGYFLQPA